MTATRVTFEKAKVENVEVEGEVTAGACGSFTVAGIVVTTSAGAQFKVGVCSDITVGEYVEVKGMKSGTTVTASRVEFEEDEVGKDFYLHGKVISGACGSFTIAGAVAITDYITWTIATTSTTVFKNGVCSNIAPGVKVDVKATKTGASSATALGVQFVY